MGTLDSNGVWRYDNNDSVTPLATFMNLGQISISDALAELRADLVAQFTIPDTGWVPLTGINSTVTAQTGANAPAIRRYGPFVMTRGRFTESSGSSGTRDLCQLPAPFPTFITSIVELGSWTIASSYKRLIISTSGLMTGSDFIGGTDEIVSINNKFFAVT